MDLKSSLDSAAAAASAIPLRIDEGRTYMDLVGSTWGSGYFLVSQRVVDAMRIAGLTGWEPLPVEIRGEPRPPVAYHGLRVRGVTGPLQRDRSEVVERLPGPHARAKMWFYRGFYFDEGGWDGSDVFRAAGTSAVIVRERVSEVLRRLAPTNLQLVSIPEVHTPLLRDEARRVIAERGGVRG